MPRIKLQINLLAVILLSHVLPIWQAAQAAESVSASSANASQPSEPKKKSFLSGLGDAIKKATAPKKIYGYYDRGNDRFYCLMDAKTGEKQDDAVSGELAKYPDGTLTVQRGRAVSLLSYNCTKLEQHGDLVVVGYAAEEKAIDRIGLRNVLPEYDEDQSIGAQYPHIAITVLKHPTDWAKPNVVTEAGIYLGCWTLKVKVWESATKSRNIEPFQFCNAQDANEVAIGFGAKWPERSKDDVKELTGIKRTDGPQPPSQIVPGDRDTVALALKDGNPSWPNVVSDRVYNATPLTRLIGELRYQMGARDSGDTSHDLRVWVVGINQ